MTVDSREDRPAEWARGRTFVPPEPPYRVLRGFAIDPAFATQFETAPFGEIEFKVPWERLDPGPVGEYLEVIDFDPASDCFYEPVDLDDPRLLAQDGLAPSEGTPQFHQQMAYAVASLTIRNFERALGRRALWRPRPNPEDVYDDSRYVRRLRIHPHALRQRNAYYSPAKVALLMGYFNEDAGTLDEPEPGPMVFTGLSHDILAHETTHALLDGMHRRFLWPSNPDVLAFHEAFADIVALFQHFTFREIVRQQIFQTRGQIRSQQNFLGKLAWQFGQATGRHNSLRDAIGTWDEATRQWVPKRPDPHRYTVVLEPHERGSILVSAVFDAFLSIYERRTADLLRLATGGTGVIEPGAIHPDLVQRLADEASKTAGHVLTMCIRALDYIPPVDITFGEYLRAILTADHDVVRDDDLGYRVAFLDAFRRHGIQPRDVRTLSVESLLWRGPADDERQPSAELEQRIGGLRQFAAECLYAESLSDEGTAGERTPEDRAGGAEYESGSTTSRRRIFDLQREARFRVHDELQRHFASSPQGPADAAFLGLDAQNPSFEVHSLRFALRGSPDGDVVPQIVMTLLQRRKTELAVGSPLGTEIWIEGGCAIVLDLRQLRIRYTIRKNVTSRGRFARQQEFALQQLDSLRATYFDSGPNRAEPEPFALLHRGS